MRSIVSEPEALQASVSGSPFRSGWLAPAALAALCVAAVSCGDQPTPPVGGGRNLRIETLYLVQSVQTADRTVPLVAGREAHLRVFAVGSAANIPAPSVRVRLLRDEVVEQEFVIPPPAAFAPASVDQAALARSWNVRIPAEHIQPGLQIVAEVDPENTTEESNEEDNRFPASGSLAVQIAPMPALRVRFVPMVQAENGKTGNVSAANAESYLTLARKLLPVSGIDIDIRAPYTVNGLGFDPQGSTWQAAVAELDAVRAAEGSDRFYYGVVNTDYEGGGVVGIAAGIPANTALGWDRFPDAPITFAHEIGHAWGRFHAPCGGAGGADPSYPYTLGLVGSYGLDLETMEVKLPSGNTDIMGYCNTRFWVSDYTFTGIFNYRLSQGTTARDPVPSLIVWGRIENGVPILEPAFEALAPPSLPSGWGPLRLAALDSSGREIFAHAFAPRPMPHASGDAGHFAFALPLSADRLGRIRSLRLAGPRGESRQAAAMTSSGRPRVSTSFVGPDQVRIRWNRSEYPLVVVRDAATGAILSLARGGDARVVAGRGGVRLGVSDGVRSHSMEVGSSRRP